MKLTIKEVAALFGADHITDETVINQVEFDSRKVQAGDLFVPLAGVRDGHDFIDAAAKNGAVAAFWSRDSQELPAGVTKIPVADPLAAMQQLAVYYKKKLAPKTVAITGSNGKTTTKDLTAAVLSQQFITYKTQGNYNNNIGMPYTILHMPDDCQLLVLEMGMDHAGELAELSVMGQPDAAAITIIGEAHIENLGSRAGIAAAKMEIVQGLATKGLLLVPADEPLLLPLLAGLSQQVTTFGIQQGDISATVIAESKERTVFEVAGKTFEIPVIGAYNVKNALIAYGFGKHFGLSDSQIAQGLATVQLTKNRTQWLTAKNGAQVLSDVYNANPTAMALVLDTFGKLQTSDGRKLAVLADMLELGPDSRQMHAAMAAHIDDSYDTVFLYGTEMTALLNALTEKDADLTVYHFDKPNKSALIQMIKAELGPADSILLKGSNGMGLSEVVEALTEE
ncbi:UDP-N-acetylmuramoyl-tripeptide--D-alanyl-D-alanine ligase [Candidatus Enterococcus leclercqii]|uniref:UDP-N-acetylmuramoyl-tripeptide--D-alanyl-D- alanine ligase n=1 Tax=Candidatus Enterococcus leclercqii TaxID=1857218 RepID=UPI00137A98F9|nr:UDP-N-acetylmuramoyl-tripeptide--D-alanyl-D-alanine ligase [Enterococcus sp. CU9D]KAF1293314.1 UDP-N-acetylmuramoyl-tripeptide--D-alanyl-D-alanine ligase [Enterococcus sp. CU9D]